MSDDGREINGDEVRRRRDRLLDRFGDAPVRERQKEPSPERFAEWRASSLAGYVGSAYALVERTPDQQSPLSESASVDGAERSRVLLVLGRGGSRWGVPGGGQEADEPLESTAEREIGEETGIEATVTGLGHLRHEVAVSKTSDDRLHVLRAFFTADYADGSIAVQPGEVVGAAWFAAPPAAERLLPATRRLLDGWDG